MLTGLHRLALLRGGIDAALEQVGMGPGSGGPGFTRPDKYYFVGQRTRSPEGVSSVTGANHMIARIYLGVFSFPAHSFRMAFPGHYNTTSATYPTEVVLPVDITIQGVAIGYGTTNDPTAATWVDGSWTDTITTANKTGLLSGEIVASGSPIPAGKHVWAQWTCTCAGSSTIPAAYKYHPSAAVTIEGSARAGSQYSATSNMALSGSNASLAYGPSAIVCKGHSGKPVALVVGDSIGGNSNETQYDYTNGINGFIYRGLAAATVPMHAANITVPGTSPMQWTHNQEAGDYVYKAKLDLIGLITTANGGTFPFTHIISEYGTNSVNGLTANTTGAGGVANGSTTPNTNDNTTGLPWNTPTGFLAGMVAYGALLKAKYPDTPIHQCTVICKGITSDGWHTLGNQTPNPNTVAQGFAFNTTIKAALPANFDGYIDTAALIGDGSNVTKWKNNATTTTLACEYISNTKGTASGATTNAAGYAQGATVITLAAAGTGTIRVGDNITFAGDTTPYIVTEGSADVSAGDTITIHTGLSQAMSAATKAITIGTVGQYCVLNAAPTVGQVIVIDPTGVGSTVSTGGSNVDAVTNNGNGTYKVLLSSIRSYGSPVTAGTTVGYTYTRDGTHPGSEGHRLMAPAITAWANSL